MDPDSLKKLSRLNWKEKESVSMLLNQANFKIFCFPLPYPVLLVWVSQSEFSNWIPIKNLS